MSSICDHMFILLTLYRIGASINITPNNLWYFCSCLMGTCCWPIDVCTYECSL